MGNGGPRNYSNAFLPTPYQGTAVGRAGIPATEAVEFIGVEPNYNLVLDGDDLEEHCHRFVLAPRSVRCRYEQQCQGTTS
jgi:hypothetical protein